jgi:hypothetical protein
MLLCHSSVLGINILLVVGFHIVVGFHMLDGKALGQGPLFLYMQTSSNEWKRGKKLEFGIF